MDGIRRDCPFCGADAPKNLSVGSSHTFGGNFTDYFVNCRLCGAQGPRRPTADGAVAAWNTEIKIKTRKEGS